MQVPPILSRSMPFVAEVFGPTFQGEGPNCGRPAGFIRFGKCNLTCVWCDTPYTWDWTRFDPDAEMRPMEPQALARRIEEMDVPIVVITGGEPLLQQAAICDIIDRLPNHDIEIETNGTIPPNAELLSRSPSFNCSPKLANSGVVEKKRYKPRALHELVKAGAVFKFVCVEVADLNEVAHFAALAEIPRDRVWVMPEGITAAEVVKHTEVLADAVVARGWNFTTRLQVLAWGGERGR